jgi:hypothetical protein
VSRVSNIINLIVGVIRRSPLVGSCQYQVLFDTLAPIPSRSFVLFSVDSDIPAWASVLINFIGWLFAVTYSSSSIAPPYPGTYRPGHFRGGAKDNAVVVDCYPNGLGLAARLLDH